MSADLSVCFIKGHSSSRVSHQPGGGSSQIAGIFGDEAPAPAPASRTPQQSATQEQKRSNPVPANKDTERLTARQLASRNASSSIIFGGDSEPVSVSVAAAPAQAMTAAPATLNNVLGESKRANVPVEAPTTAQQKSSVRVRQPPGGASQIFF